MKKQLLSLSLAALFAIALSVSPQVGIQKAAAQRATQQVQPVYYLAPDEFSLLGVVPDAYATLARTQNGITTDVHTSGIPGAYTLWWVIYNHPENCTDPADTYLCEYDLPDIVLNATGHINGNGGNLDLSAHLTADGPISGEVICPGILSGDCPGTGLTNPKDAAVLLVVRYHGPVTPGVVPQQISTFLGGCPDGGAPCTDPQIVVFAP